MISVRPQAGAQLALSDIRSLPLTDHLPAEPAYASEGKPAPCTLHASLGGARLKTEDSAHASSFQTERIGSIGCTQCFELRAIEPDLRAEPTLKSPRRTCRYDCVRYCSLETWKHPEM
jgi:hypothetical protein